MFPPETQPRFLSHLVHNLATIANPLTGLRFYNTLQKHQLRQSNTNIFIAFGGKSGHMSSTLRVGNCGGRLDNKERVGTVQLAEGMLTV